MNKITERVNDRICPNCGNDIINKVTVQKEVKKLNNTNYLDGIFPHMEDTYYVCVDCGIRFEKTDKNGK